MKPLNKNLFLSPWFDCLTYILNLLFESWFSYFESRILNLYSRMNLLGFRTKRHTIRYYSINTLTYFCFVECKNGTYGYYCSGHCAGHCLNNSPCNKKSGHCERGCTPGYTDIDCSKRKWFLPLTLKNTCISSCSQTLFNRLMEGSITGSILKLVYYFSLLFYYSISYTLFLLKLYNFSDIKCLRTDV